MAVVAALLLAGVGRAGVGGGAGSPAFRPGPTALAELPPPQGPGAFVPWAEAGDGRWPEGVRAALEEALAGSGGVLVVGTTDAVGPTALNQSLGLQFAREAARRLIQAFGVAPWRVAYGSLGELGGGVPGIALRPWSPPAGEPGAPAPVAVLAPVSGLARPARLWGAWGGAEAVGWRLGSVVWEVPAAVGVLNHPLPATGFDSVLGVFGRGRGVRVAAVEAPGVAGSAGLTARVEAVDAWSARLRVQVPQGYLAPVLWVGAVAYPLVPGRVESDLSVALFPAPTEAFVQAQDGRGRVVRGAVVPVPGGEGPPPDLLAVLVWQGAGVDLDLHGWAGDRHTHAQAPDGAMFSEAVPGTRLLFEGGAEAPVSAFAAWGAPGLTLEARCYSDLGSGGATGWLYLVERPGDPLEARYRILGPRRLSGAPREARWPAWNGGS